MAIKRLSVEEIPEQPKILPLEKTPSPPPIEDKTKFYAQKDVEYAQINAFFIFAAKILAIRFFLFLSLVGSFVLALIATQDLAIQSAWVLLIYAAVTTLPLTILEWKNKG